MSSKIELPFLDIKLGGSPVVIAEIGINHNGCLDTAIKMADLAKIVLILLNIKHTL